MIKTPENWIRIIVRVDGKIVKEHLLFDQDLYRIIEKIPQILKLTPEAVQHLNTERRR